MNPSTVTRNIKQMKNHKAFGPKFRKAVEKREAFERRESALPLRERRRIREAAEQRARGERERQAT